MGPAVKPRSFDAGEFVGLPWLDRGRDRLGVDCYGGFRLAFEAATGIELPSLAEFYATVADRAVVAALVEDGRTVWHPVPLAAARLCDAVLMHGSPWHIGMVATERPVRVLHVPEGRSSVIEPISSGRLRRRVEGLYRHEALL